MKYVLNGKIYDTDKAEEMCVGRLSRPYDFNSTYVVVPVVLYQTKKGNYFVVYCHDHHAEAISEECAKQILQESDYEKYVESFGELEEA